MKITEFHTCKYDWALVAGPIDVCTGEGFGVTRNKALFDLPIASLGQRT
jgi:hypothetical protein